MSGNLREELARSGLIHQPLSDIWGNSLEQERKKDLPQDISVREERQPSPAGRRICFTSSPMTTEPVYTAIR